MTQDQVRYVGFSVAAGARNYQFEVQAGDAERLVRVFTLSVAALHFSSGKIRFQQGPDIACRKLHVMLAQEGSGEPIALSQSLSDSDVADYASDVAPAPKQKHWNAAARAASHT
jgi:hypothetical protein